MSDDLGAPENKPFYIAVWRHVLTGWLRWPDERTGRWILHYDEELEGRGNPWFYHEEAIWHIKHFLIPKRLCNSEGMRPCDCRGGSKRQSGLATTWSVIQHSTGTPHDNGLKQFYMNTAKPLQALTITSPMCVGYSVPIAPETNVMPTVRLGATYSTKCP